MQLVAARRGLVAIFFVVLLASVAGCVPESLRVSDGSGGEPSTSTELTPLNSIDATGSRDVTAELQAFLSRVPHHSRISFPANAQYRIEGTLNVKNRNDIIVDGNGATFFATEPTSSRTRSQWRFENISNLIVQDMTIRGANPRAGLADEAYVGALEGQHGIEVLGGERIAVRRVAISDTYGDLMFVGRSGGPVFGRPTNVSIQDSEFRRSGRQGIAVVDASDVVIERNRISETRRATIDLEAYTSTAVVRRIHIRNNDIGAGRLMFVAVKGAGDASDIYVQNNRLTRPMDMDFNALEARRSNVVVTGNVSTDTVGNPRGAAIRFVRYDGVIVRDNVQPAQPSRNMYMVGSQNSCFVTATGNDLGPHGAGQLTVLDASYDCERSVLAPSSGPEAVFSGERLTVDAGGSGYPVLDIAPCSGPEACEGFISSGGAQVLTSDRLVNVETSGVLYRTMLHGDPRFAIPIRSGTYTVELAFVEPSVDTRRARYFHVDIERSRVLSSFDVWKEAGGAKNKLVKRTFTTTVGDGHLNIDFQYGFNGAIISLVTVRRA